MTQIAVRAVIKIIGVFAVLVVALKSMRQRAERKKFPGLLEKFALKIIISLRRVGGLDPFAAIPDRKIAVRAEYRNY